jgi:hypothetical protein
LTTSVSGGTVLVTGEPNPLVETGTNHQFQHTHFGLKNRISLIMPVPL